MTARSSFLLGADYAGKSSTMSPLAASPSRWELVSADSGFVAGAHALVSRLRRDLFEDVLPSLGRDYSPEFMASLLQTAVVHLRDRIRQSTLGHEAPGYRQARAGPAGWMPRRCVTSTATPSFGTGSRLSAAASAPHRSKTACSGRTRPNGSG